MVNKVGNYRLVGELCPFHLISVTLASVHFTAVMRAM